MNIVKQNILALAFILVPIVSNAQLNNLLQFAIDKIDSEVKDWSYKTQLENFERQHPQASPFEKYINQNIVYATVYHSINWSTLLMDGSDLLVDYLENANFEEEAAKLANFEYDTTKLGDINNKFGLYNVATAYSNMPNVLINKTNNIINSYSPKKISYMAQGKVGNYINLMIEESKKESAKQLPELLKPNSMEVLRNNYPNVYNQLNNDVSNNRRMAMLINLNPELYLDYYAKNVNNSNFKTNKNIVYWTEQFNNKPEKWPTKVPFLQFSDLGFEDNSKVTAGTRTIVKYNNNVYSVEDMEYLNHTLIGDETIKFQDLTITTDAIGRIKSISDYNLNKGKNPFKTKVKSKTLMSFHENSNDAKPYFAVPKKYKGPECLANIVPIKNTPYNKATIKEINKQISTIFKEKKQCNYRVTFEYDGATNIISGLKIEINGSEFNLKN